MWIHMKHTINSVFGWLYMYLLQTITLLLYKPDTCWSWWVSLLWDFSVCHFHGHFLLFHRKVSIENYLCKTDTSIRWTFLLVRKGVPLNRFQCMSFAEKNEINRGNHLYVFLPKNKRCTKSNKLYFNIFYQIYGFLVF